MAFLPVLPPPSPQAMPPIAPPSGQPGVAPTEELVQDVALDLIGRAPDASSPTSTATEVLVRGQIGNKELSFKFSILFMGEKVPVNLEVLQQLALGCERTLTSAYDRRLQIAQQLQERQRLAQQEPKDNSKLSRTEEKELKKAQTELAIFSNIRSFTFEAESNIPTLVISSLNPHTNKEVKLSIRLDPEFDGAAQAVRSTLMGLQAELQELQFQLREIQIQLEAVRSQNAAFKDRLEHLHEIMATLVNIDNRTDLQQAELENLRNQFREIRESLDQGKELETDLEQTLIQLDNETKARRDRLEVQIQALKHAHLHKVVIQAYDRQRGSAEDSANTKYKAVVELYRLVEVNGKEEPEKFDEIELTNPQCPVIFYAQELASPNRIFNDITNLVSEAQKGTTDETKEFAKAIEEKQKKNQPQNGSPQYSPEQLMRLRQQMAAMQPQQPQASQ